jgi:hypothetical protein
VSGYGRLGLIGSEHVLEIFGIEIAVIAPPAVTKVHNDGYLLARDPS